MQAQAFERRRGELVLRPLAAWHEHQAFLRVRHMLGQRVTMTTHEGQHRHEGVIVAMYDDGAWMWSSALSRVRYETSSHRMNSRSVTYSATMAIVRVESTNGVERPQDACPHHTRD